ncbi:hypothetical protein ACKFRM_06365 [Corynebacterium sp. YSMAA1_1_D6]|uniref:hypothetical protein n=1 Tax=Corynebacterium sp. YSMAA1_1_D6 TaxID=3383589 RepID=UPI0038D11ABE
MWSCTDKAASITRAAAAGTNSVACARATVDNDPKGFFISVKLEVTLPNLKQEDAQALADAAHEAYPYSKATRGNIDVGVTVAED